MNLHDLGDRLVTAMPDALIVADAEGIIRLWNGAAERMFGFSADEALGRSRDIITPERLRARHWAGFHQTMRTGQTRYGAGDLLSVPAVRKDGQQISIQFSILPLEGPDGGLQGIAVIMRDVTSDFMARKALQRELDACRRKLNDG